MRLERMSWKDCEEYFKDHDMVPAIAQANGCEAELKYVRECGSVINSPEQTEAALKVTGQLLGEDHVKVIEPFMSSEDFSEYLQKVPGCSTKRYDAVREMRPIRS